jgi:hypothetical protein
MPGVMRGRRRRRWPFVLLGVLTAGSAYLGIAGGASRATADAASAAARLTSEEQYSAAISLDGVIARRTGPLFIFDRSDPASAPLNAQRVMLRWAMALDQQGKVDQAVAVVSGVTDPRLRATALQQRAKILVDAAKADAARGDFASAVSRIEQLQALDVTGSIEAEASELLPQYQVGEAELLTGRGEGADAVTLLDQAAQEGSDAAAAAAAAYPAALLAAGQQALAADSYREAVSMLQRLVQNFPASAEATEAQSLLDGPEPVTGTLVDSGGHPISGRVRLSSHFYTVSGGYYTTGPFFYSTADSSGTFRFDSIPQGGPYILEIYRGGDWTTYVDPSTGQPANPVTVSPLIPVDLTFVELPG